MHARLRLQWIPFPGLPFPGLPVLATLAWLASAGPLPSRPLFAQETQTLASLNKLSAENDWPWWRGPLRNGISAAKQVPTRLGETENLKWKTPVPGRSHSSPIVVGSQVFLTTADEGEQTQSVLAFDRENGKRLWQLQVNRGGFPEHNHAKNTEASSTLACDGERIFATFFNHKTIQLVAIDLAGKLLWQKSAGAFDPQRFEYGYAPSPLIYRDLVIVAAEYDGDSFLAAFQRETGDEAWRAPRPNGITFSSPVVTHVAGRDQLLISGHSEVAAYDPATGKRIWATPGTTNATCGTMVWSGDIVVASGGYPKAETIAVRADGSGKVLWRNNQKCYEQSLLVVDGHVYGLTDGGVFYCWRAEDGKEMWKQRLRGPVSASPVLAGGNIYWANELGTLYVVRPNPAQFELVAENQLGSASFPSPAVAGRQLFLRVASEESGRRQETLYCFETDEPSAAK